jgi:hypothetical protein
VSETDLWYRLYGSPAPRGRARAVGGDDIESAARTDGHGRRQFQKDSDCYENLKGRSSQFERVVALDGYGSREV